MLTHNSHLWPDWQRGTMHIRVSRDEGHDAQEVRRDEGDCT